MTTSDSKALVFQGPSLVETILGDQIQVAYDDAMPPQVYIRYSGTIAKVVVVPTDVWIEFIDGVKKGEFDHPWLKAQ